MSALTATLGSGQADLQTRIGVALGILDRHRTEFETVIKGIGSLPAQDRKALDGSVDPAVATGLRAQLTIQHERDIHDAWMANLFVGASRCIEASREP